MAMPKRGSRNSEAKQSSDEFMEKLKIFVRTDGANFLHDPNIASERMNLEQGKAQGGARC